MARSIKYDNSANTARFNLKQVRKIRRALIDRDKRIDYLRKTKQKIQSEITALRKRHIVHKIILAHRHRISVSRVSSIILINGRIKLDTNNGHNKISIKQAILIRKKLKPQLIRLKYLRNKRDKIQKQLSGIYYSTNINTLAKKYKVNKSTISRIKKR